LLKVADLAKLNVVSFNADGLAGTNRKVVEWPEKDRLYRNTRESTVDEMAAPEDG
jgi:hypothetical protein